MIVHLLEVIDEPIDIGEFLYRDIVVGLELGLWFLLATGGESVLFAVLDLVDFFFVDLGELSEGGEAAVEVGDLVKSSVDLLIAADGREVDYFCGREGEEE